MRKKDVCNLKRRRPGGRRDRDNGRTKNQRGSESRKKGIDERERVRRSCSDARGGRFGGRRPHSVLEGEGRRRADRRSRARFDSFLPVCISLAVRRRATLPRELLSGLLATQAARACQLRRTFLPAVAGRRLQLIERGRRSWALGRWRSFVARPARSSSPVAI